MAQAEKPYRRKSVTIALREISKTRKLYRSQHGNGDHWRPQCLSDCEGIEKPCLFVGCKYNTYLDVKPHNGSIQFNWPGLEPGDMLADYSCTIDIANRFGELDSNDVARIMNVSKQHISSFLKSIREKLRRESE